MRREASGTMSQRYRARPGWHLDEPVTSCAQRCYLATAFCGSHRGCAPLRRASTAGAWHRQEQDRYEQYHFCLRFALCDFWSLCRTLLNRPWDSQSAPCRNRTSGSGSCPHASFVAEALKLATNRERPNEGNGQGGFWPHGTHSYELNSAFPSGHAAASFALARVIASEYPSKPVQMAAYAFALAISASRVTARQHFPSDVLVGGTFGYLIGSYVVRHHSDENLSAGFSFVPVVDMPTHTFGASVDIRPEQFGFTRICRFVNRMLPNTRRAEVAAERSVYAVRDYTRLKEQLVGRRNKSRPLADSSWRRRCFADVLDPALRR